jgi:hypothetical protein
MPPAVALIEELRRFHFALTWLATSSLVRVTNPGADTSGTEGAMVSLIHDGFGRPLRDWARELPNAGALHALTAPRDATFFFWKDRDEADLRPPDVGGPDRLRVIPNLRWKGGSVRCDFQNVVFVNCDFRGALFDSCRLEGVNFVNCILDGAIFSDCIIEGVLDRLDHDVDWTLAEPTFEVAVDDALVAEFRPYGWEPRSRRNVFYSGMPGSPARPSNGDQPNLGPESHPVVAGGIAVYGGRISSLGMRRCRIAPNSGVGLRHTTGSGLELVELVGSGRYDIFGSALRHVTLSSQPDDEEEPSVDVAITNTLLTQLWISDDIAGMINVNDCTVVQAWNGPNLEMKVVKSKLQGIGGPNPRTTTRLHLEDEEDEVEGSVDLDKLPESVRLDKLSRFAEQSMRADYRRNPAATAARRAERDRHEGGATDGE